ncbi:asparaginase [Labedella endophytica]|uniref:Asparaginase n=1 Tax=Labedella endophytica TaxID=1523160 RepID=A0A3S0VTR0_9MICO|nr:asparaginase [Labedella endophytica]RUR01151.1 asparaginase [Labedella endophytica]
MSSTGTFTPVEAAELAVVERSGFVESRHIGSAVVLSPDGTVLRSHGSPNAPVFPRSSMKPFQALAVLNAGVALRDEQAALATASHAGTTRHVSVVRSMLATAALTEDALQCPMDWPLDRSTRDELIGSHHGQSRLFMNCSGKHAAMLLACVTNGWPIDSYLDVAHPLQVAVRDTVERLTGERPAATAVDGCGAPVFAIGLTALARGIQKIATASVSSPFALYRNAAIIVDAVRRHPWAIDGPGRDNTVAIERLGVFAKGGAEGVMVMTAPDGTTVTSKTLDGSSRAATVVALALLVEAGALERAAVDAVLPDLHLDVLGGGVPVGRIRSVVGA